MYIKNTYTHIYGCSYILKSTVTVNAYGMYCPKRCFFLPNKYYLFIFSYQYMYTCIISFQVHSNLCPNYNIFTDSYCFVLSFTVKIVLQWSLYFYKTIKINIFFSIMDWISVVSLENPTGISKVLCVVENFLLLWFTFNQDAQLI